MPESVTPVTTPLTVGLRPRIPRLYAKWKAQNSSCGGSPSRERLFVTSSSFSFPYNPAMDTATAPITAHLETFEELRVAKRWTTNTVIAKVAIIVAVGTTVACGDRTPPVLGDVVVAQPSEHTPLAALLTFSTDEPGRVSLEIADGDRTWSVTPVDEYRTNHEVPVLGLRPDRSHDVTVIVSDEAGNDASAPPVTIRTDPLPEDFPPLDVRVSLELRIVQGGCHLSFLLWVGVDDAAFRGRSGARRRPRREPSDSTAGGAS